MSNEIQENMRQLFRAARRGDQQRGWGCPDDSVIAAFADGQVESQERSKLEAHLDKCDYCRGQVAFLLRANEAEVPASVPAAWLARVQKLVGSGQPVSSGWRWRWQTFAAAAACIIVVSVITVRKPRHDGFLGPERAPDSASTLRSVTAPSSLPELISPTPDSVAPQRGMEIRWKPFAGAQEYGVTVTTESGEPVWQQRTDQTSVKLPGRVSLAPEQKFFVLIRVFLPDGKTMQSRAVSFTTANTH